MTLRDSIVDNILKHASILWRLISHFSILASYCNQISGDIKMVGGI